ncbi:OmpH family outer membrane protein [Ameyamaea chiangmaiensis]|uniref:OmpH family outer membrane protein n=1 Tax=Ameyamaea chiangmaiensis TaxID=442969 RepID=UPI001BAFAE6C|nr:OmpH family outer membrane protein [Ameyamaea chiangmaiensis]MBS4074421.1 OmpH family outer membrane protein [Ameyamaea chiangmaiensis]
MSRFAGASAALAAVLALGAVPALAQSSGGNAGWFVPKSNQPPPPQPHAVRRAPEPVATVPPGSGDDDSGQPQTPPVLPAPTVPAPGDVAKGAPPPTAVIGVISVPDVMRISAAAQEAEQVLGARRDKLAQDVQRAQAGWRDEQQQLQSQAKGLSSDQIQARERHLQDRVLTAQRDFRNRNRIIQEAAQVSLNQIERELVQIIRAVASAHGMNLVMHSEQVALHVDGQDISRQVADQLNKVLPHVFIPAENVDPEVLAKSGTMPTTADEARAQQHQQAGDAPSEPPPPPSVVRRPQQ